MAFLIILIRRWPSILFRSRGDDSSVDGRFESTGAGASRCGCACAEADAEILCRLDLGSVVADAGGTVASGAAAGVGDGCLVAAVDRALEAGFAVPDGAFGAEAFALLAALAAAGFFAVVRVLLCGFFDSVAGAPALFAEARDCPCVEPLGFLSLGFVMVTAPGCSRGVEEEGAPCMIK